MKGASARAVNVSTTVPDGSKFAWQNEFGVMTFGEKALADVCRYVNLIALASAHNQPPVGGMMRSRPSPHRGASKTTRPTTPSSPPERVPASVPCSHGDG